MKQEDKDLLLKDLCARLPYGVKVDIAYSKECGSSLRSKICSEGVSKMDTLIFWLFQEGEVHLRPYLFPLSSMTEEQSIELFKLFGISLVDSIGADYIKINECTGVTFFLDKGFDIETHLDKLIDWLNKNHFDYHDLINKNLAIDCTNLNIY